MAQPRSHKIFLSAVVLIFTSAAAHSQTAYQQPSKAQAGGAVTLVECEGMKCTPWTFHGTKGYGRWEDGEVAMLLVESAKDDKMVISRTDMAGPREGLTATYTGTLHGDKQLGGEYTSLYQGKKESGIWYWTVEENPVRPPSVMHVCAAHCGTWILDDGPPFDKPHYGKPPFMVTVESFTRASVIMHRTDAPNQYFPQGLKFDYSAKISSQGNKIINGTQVNTFGNPGAPFTFSACWGAALNDCPGSDAERDSGRRSPPPPGSITAGDIIQGAKNIRDAIELYRFFAALLQ